MNQERKKGDPLDNAGASSLFGRVADVQPLLLLQDRMPSRPDLVPDELEAHPHRW